MKIFLEAFGLLVLVIAVWCAGYQDGRIKSCDSVHQMTQNWTSQKSNDNLLQIPNNPRTHVYGQPPGGGVSGLHGFHAD